ncbi:MAG: SLOG family protein [Clostridia bacterium]
MLPPLFEGKTACCFTGHRPRGLPKHGNECSSSMILLKHTLLQAVEEAVNYGITTFLTGGAEGFDTLAAEAVLALRGDYPALHLVLSLPSKVQSEAYSPSMQARYARILSAADSVFYASDIDNGPHAMRCRNRYLVDHAECCIAYLARAVGGTLYTVNYAYDRNVPVFNLYEFVKS